jgi:hypothetical protein
MREIREITRYHDILDEIINNPEVRDSFNWEGAADIKTNILSIQRTLCWILNHDQGRWLENNMNTLENDNKRSHNNVTNNNRPR